MQLKQGEPPRRSGSTSIPHLTPQPPHGFRLVQILAP